MKVSAEYLETLQYRIGIIANNIANVNTPGFKEGLLFIEETNDMQDRSKSVAQYGGVMPGAENAAIINRNMYVGSRIDFRQGALVETGNTFDLAITGEGFFQIKTPDGKIGYTRAGLFSRDSMGNLVNNEGMLLEPRINIPLNASEIAIKSDGTIRGILLKEAVEDTEAFEEWDYMEDFEDSEDSEEGSDGMVTFGRISLFRFDNPDGLEQIGSNTYVPTEASGEAEEGIAGSEGYGELVSGMIERSNTDLVSAMTKLMEAQRAYQFDLRIIKNQDEMMQQAIAMRG